MPYGLDEAVQPQAPKVDNSEAVSIVRRFDSLYASDATWRATWQEVADYIFPRVSNILAKLTSGEKLTTKLYDAEGVKANQDLSAALSGSMTSAAIMWFLLKMRQKELNEMYEVKLWLEEVRDRMYLAIQQSNFSAEVNEFFLYLSAFGTAAMQIEEKAGASPFFRGLLFRTLPIASYVIAENAEGYVDVLIHKFEYTYNQAKEAFGLEALSEKAQNKLKANKGDEKMTVLHAVYPGETSHPDHKYIDHYIDYADKHTMHKGGFYEFPYICVRWSKDASELWGRGPGHTALPDIKTLNTAVKLRLKSWAKQVDPPMLVLDDGVIGRPRLTPGSLNTGRTKDALTPIENNARIDFAIQQEERLSAKIRNIFFADRIQLPSKQYMTAYEVQALREQMQQMLGPTTGRIESEGLTPLITRVFGLMMRTQALPPPPDVVASTPGAEIDVRYEGPLARAQRSGNLQAVQQTLQIAAPIMQVSPDVVDNFEFDDVVRDVAESSGMPARHLKDKRKVAEIRAARAQQQTDMADAQQQAQDAQNMKAVTPALKVAEDAAQKNNDQGFPPAGSKGQ